MLHFNNVGLYNGLFVMQDEESKTLWNHITGEALYGPHVGRTLGPIANLMQMNVQEALELDPAMEVAISDRPYTGRSDIPGRGTLGDDAQLMPMFVETLGKEDTRRPRMDMGLGIWTAETRRYYPMEEIRAHEGTLIDRLDDRNILVFIESRSATPTALFVDAQSATVEGNDIRLDTGAVVRSGLLFDSDGTRLEDERPQQIFTRWYGYALTFPGAEVFGR
jgi:Protein of unknown function (DUF3179)